MANEARVTRDRTGAAPRSAAGARAPVQPPTWALVSATIAPVAMIGGWTVAAARQAAAFDPVRDTISALATSAATAGWIMTAGLAVTGVCHVITAAGLRAAAPGGRVLLAVGGVATAAVAALPVDVAPGAHGAAAGVAFVALSVWPAAAGRPGARGVLRRRRGTAATTGLVALLVWFVLELQGAPPASGALTGLAERALAGAQSLWPLVVVAALRRSPGGKRSEPGRVVRGRPAADPAADRAAGTGDAVTPWSA